MVVAVERIAESICKQVISRGYRAANELRNAELEVLSGPRSGRVYGKHRASAPGEPPAVKSGNLRRNWVLNVVPQATSVEAEIKSMSGKYAEYMEHGTPGGKIKPRPYVDRIRDKAEPKIEEIYNEPYV